MPALRRHTQASHDERHRQDRDAVRDGHRSLSRTCRGRREADHDGARRVHGDRRRGHARIRHGVIAGRGDADDPKCARPRVRHRHLQRRGISDALAPEIQWRRVD